MVSWCSEPQNSACNEIKWQLTSAITPPPCPCCGIKVAALERVVHDAHETIAALRQYASGAARELEESLCGSGSDRACMARHRTCVRGWRSAHATTGVSRRCASS
eukprot:190529-Chlamydomonas_euryale.AAC.7